MNKVYKLVWSKVRSAWVVTSEIAKGHGKDSSSGRNRKLLRSGVVMALLGSFFTVGMPSVAALTQEEENSIVNAIMQRLETERKTPHYLSVYVSKDKKGANYNNDAASDLHSIAVGENTQTNSDSIAIGYNATVYNKKTLMDNWWNGVNHPWWKSDTSYYNLQSLREVDDGKFKDEWAVDYLRGRHSVAIGTYSRANDTMTIAIGYKASAGVPGGMNTVAPQVAIGALAEASGVDSIALGAGATSRTYAGVSIGYGAFNYGGYYGIAIGQFSRAEQEGGIAMGWRARVQGEYGLALGNSTRVMGGQGNVALGYGSVADRTIYYPPYLAEDKGVMDTVEGQQGVVSIGNSNTIWNPDDKPEGPKPALSKRQLINLAAGTEDSDAVNVAQLKAVNNKADKLDKRISEEKAHYFSVSGVSRDDRSNYHNNATNGVEKSLAIGEYVVANDYSVAIGYGAKNNFDTEYKNGQTVKRTHYYSMGLLKDRVGSPRFNGEWAYDKIRGSHTVAIGDRASTNDTMGIAIGYKASAGKLGTNNAVAPQIAVGALAEASGSSTIAVGEGATAEMDSSIAIGTGAYAKPTGSEDIHSIAFGTYSRSEATESMAFGHHAKALTNRSIAIGAGSEAKASSGVALGYSSVADRARSLDPYLKGEGKVSDTVYGTLGAVSIGNPYGDRLYDNIRVGWYAEKGTRQLTNLAAGSEDSDAVNVAQLRVIDDKKANLDASNLTKASDKSAWATVLGTGTITQNDANLVTGDTVYQYIKNNVKATKVTVDGKEESQDGNLKIKKTDDNGQLTYDLSLNDEITIGKKGTPGEDGAPGKDGVDGKIGINGKDGRSADITIGKGAAGVDGKDGEAGQAGKDGITRIIYKDEKGETRQVATLDDGLKFKGDNDTVVTRKLNTQLAITGGITNESLVTTGNIGVFGTQDGGLAVKLAKNLKGLSSAEFKGDGDKVTNITAQTITQKDGDNITNIKAGDVSVTRKDGDTNKTVNLWELGKTVETNAKATKVTVDGKENNSDDADANLKITNKTVNGQTTYDLSLNNEITLGKAGTPGEGGAPGKDGVDGKIGINGKDGRSADITIGKGAAGVDGKDGEAGQAGKDGITRIIYKDEKGETRQVATLDDGLKFKGDNDTVVTRKLNTQLAITGGAKTDLSENNIGVTGNADGSMLVQLAKNLKGLSSAEFKAGDNVTNITPGDVSVTRKEGNENKTVNLWELGKTVETNAKATKVTVDGNENKTDGNLKIKKTEKDGQLTYDLSLNDEITIGKKGTPGEDGAPGKDGVDGKIGINGKDGRSADITIGKGAAGVDGKDGEAGQAGKDGITRIIYKDEKGETRQVATLDDGLKFKGDNDTVVTRKLNTQLAITGGAKTDLSENNIGVTGNADGSMLVQLAKNLKGLTSAEFKDGDNVTNITAQTITQKDGDNVTNIKAGDVSVTKKDGDTTKTVNLWDLSKKVETNAKATKVTVDGKENNTDGNLKIKKTDDNGQLTYDLSLNDEITIGKKGTPGEDGAPGKDGVDGKIGINGKDGRSADITIGKGAAGVDGKDGEAGQAGKDGITRIIYKDEKGETRQVATLDDGLKFKGDNDTVVTRKLNTQLAITGGITNESLVTTGNIGVFGTQDGGLAVKLAKNLKGLSSAEFKGDGDKVTNITAQTITQKDGDNITNIKAGDVSVTRKDGDTNKTVNLWELGKTVETNAKATKVTVDGEENKTDGNLKIKKTDDNGQLTYDLSLNDEITIGKKGTPGEDGAPGKDGVDGKIGINGKDGRSADITIGKGAAGVDGKDGEAGQAGKDGITRIIYKDEKGETRQVATLDDGLKFKGDNDTIVTRKLNTQLAITGGITNESLVTTGNIGVFGTQDGGMAVKLSKNLKGLTSAEFKDGDNVTNITAGDISITKKDGDTTKTVNLWDLSKTVETNAKATKVTVDGEENSQNGNLTIKKTEKDGQLTYDLSLNDNITIGKDGKDGKIGINGKDGKSADITVGKGEAGVDGKDGETITRIIYTDKDGKEHKVATLDDGLKFKGDNDTVVTRKLNQQLNITGGADAADLSDNNIGVVGAAGDNGGMKVKLSKKLKGLTSAEFKDGDNVTNIKAGDISITKNEGGKTTTRTFWEISNKVDENTTKINNIETNIDTKIDQKIEDAKITVEGDTDTGVKATAVTDNADKVTGYKVSLDKKVTVGNVTIDGTGEGADKKGEITGLTNKNWDGENIVSGRAATEDQLKAAMGKVQAQSRTTVKGSKNITVTPNTASAAEYTVGLANDISVNSVTANEYKVGDKTYINQDGINANGKKITNVADGTVSADSTDAVNGKQLYEVSQQIEKSTMGNVQKELSAMGDRVDKVGAGAAALAGLHPLDFDPENKWDFAASYGNYNGANAVAIGAFYRPNESKMFSVGGSFGGGENMLNVGFSMKVGKGNEYMKLSRPEMAQKLEEQSKEIQEMKAKDQERDAQMQEIMRQLQLLQAQAAK